MPFEYTPPKYAQVIEEIQRRIERGEYPPGSLLPSEHQLAEEFSIARPTVVRALRVLREDGWIDTQQGKGSFVRGRPALAGLASARPGEAELDRDESSEPGELLDVGTSRPPKRIATLLNLGEDAEILRRRRLIRRDGEAAELVTWWVPDTLADGTGLAGTSAVRGGLRAHLAKRTGARIDHVVEEVVARQPSAREARLLGIARSDPVLALYVAARDAAGRPLLVIDVAMPGDRYELEAAYQVG